MRLTSGVFIGQFVPGESIAHSLDPRCKIVGIFVLLGGLFTARSPVDFIPWVLMLEALSRLSRISVKTILKAGRPVVFLAALTVLLNMFWTPGRELARLGFLRITEEGLILAFSMGLRLYFLVIFAALLMMTTSPMSFSDGLECLLSPLSLIKLPVSEMAMMMTIALRFIPTFFEETDRIIKAQMSRGADFESGGLIRRARAFIPVLVPLFVLVFARAENLATAMESRCYVPGAPRSKLHPLAWGARDTAAIACAAAFVLFSVLWGRYFGVFRAWLAVLEISYDGSRFFGWQSQPNGMGAQDALENALALIGERTRIFGAGRTDAGVHARAQVAHFDASREWDARRLVLAINARLPSSVSVMRASRVRDDFHARRSAVLREYRYFIWNSPVCRPYVKPFVLWLPGSHYDWSRASRCAGLLAGEHDFGAFCREADRPGNTVRTVSHARLHKRGNMSVFRIIADSYLTNMARVMVGNLLAVASGRKDENWFSSLLSGARRSASAQTTAPSGLFLWRVDYGEDIWAEKIPPQNTGGSP